LAGTAAAAEDEMDSDEDIVVTTGEVNQKCPYTMKEVGSVVLLWPAAMSQKQLSASVRSLQSAVLSLQGMLCCCFSITC